MKKQLIGTLFLSILWLTSLVAQESKQVKVKISTPYGDMIAVLYNETPQHRDNFVKLINEGWYNNSPFHRVIKNFMIQGGHNADGRVDPGYTVPAEFMEGLFHKKGALSAARMGDPVNPEKASSGCQFYIVQGRVYDPAQLGSGNYTEEQIKTYSTIGGTPHLDRGYTVFGEVVEGLDVIDKIAAVQTAAGDRPVDNVTMTITILK